MSILFRYLSREILLHVAAAASVVLSIFLLRRLGSFVAEAAEGSVPANAVFELVSLRTVMALPSLVSIAVYLGMLLGLGRLYRDRELIALAACGVSPRRILRSVLVFAFCAALVVGVLSLFVRPWAAAEFDALMAGVKRNLNVSGLAPGRFWEMAAYADGEYVVFIESRAEDGTMQNVFVQERHPKQLSILFSERAVETVDRDMGYRFLTLLEGYRYDMGADTGDYEITDYRSYVIRTALAEASDEDGGQRRADSSIALLRAVEPAAIAEMQWRTAIPISVLILALMAVPLSRVDSARSRYGRLFAAIVIYLVYNQLLTTARHWVAQGELHPFPGLWGVHLVFAVLALVLATRDPMYGRWSGRRPRPALAAAEAAPVAGGRKGGKA